MSRQRTTEFLTDLMARRGRPTPGHDSIWFLERRGGTIIQPTAFAPDATSHRGDYYYNAATNTLYRRVVTRREPGVVAAHWQKASD